MNDSSKLIIRIIIRITNQMEYTFRSAMFPLKHLDSMTCNLILTIIFSNQLNRTSIIHLIILHCSIKQLEYQTNQFLICLPNHNPRHFRKQPLMTGMMKCYEFLHLIDCVLELMTSIYLMNHLVNRYLLLKNTSKKMRFINRFYLDNQNE